MPAPKLVFPATLPEHRQLTVFRGVPLEVDPEPILIIPMMDPAQLRTLQEANLARRAQIEHEYEVVIPDHHFSSALSEARWLQRAHHLLWWTMLEDPCGGCWVYPGIVTLSLDELGERLEARRMRPTAVRAT